MKKLVIILLAFGVLVSVFSGEARSFELSVSPNYGMVLSPDLGGDSGGLGYTVRLLMAGSMFTNYEMGFETGVLPIRKYDRGDDEITFDTIPITVILRCNFYALGDIKPYFLGGGRCLSYQRE